MKKNTGLAAEIEADILRDDKSSCVDIIKCFSCGYSMVYKGRRLCSDRCRAWYDAGNPGCAQDWLTPKKPDAPLKVIAGPPSVKIGSTYYFGKRDPVAMRPTKHGFMIRCAHCGAEFESRGLRCCSPGCEAQMSKPIPQRRQRRPKIAHYTVKVSGHGHWQPSQSLRQLGFKSVDLGFDRPEAWAKATELNEAASRTRKTA